MLDVSWILTAMNDDAGVQQPDVIRQALSIKTAEGQPLFDSVQATWNLLEQSAGESSLMSE